MKRMRKQKKSQACSKNNERSSRQRGGLLISGRSCEVKVGIEDRLNVEYREEVLFIVEEKLIESPCRE